MFQAVVVFLASWAQYCFARNAEKMLLDASSSSLESVLGGSWDLVRALATKSHDPLSSLRNQPACWGSEELQRKAQGIYS
eukprot:s592_g8.t1